MSLQENCFFLLCILYAFPDSCGTRGVHRGRHRDGGVPEVYRGTQLLSKLREKRRGEERDRERDIFVSHGYCLSLCFNGKVESA